MINISISSETKNLGHISITSLIPLPGPFSSPKPPSGSPPAPPIPTPPIPPP